MKPTCDTAAMNNGIFLTRITLMAATLLLLLTTSCKEGQSRPSWQAPNGYEEVATADTGSGVNVLWISSGPQRSCWIVEARKHVAGEHMGSVSACPSQGSSSAAVVLDSIIGVLPLEVDGSARISSTNTQTLTEVPVHDRFFLASRGSLNIGDNVTITLIDSSAAVVDSFETRIS